MANSLLAYLYTHIKGSQEDIATLSLHYLLSQSKELKIAFNNLISKQLKVDVSDDIYYRCQQSGKNKERPDMSGINKDGREEILCEMKFYAGLTENQPNTYLKRLKNNEGKGLIFICPERRKNTLWTKLKELCECKEVHDLDEWCIDVGNIHMAIISWKEILFVLNKVASTVALEYKSDVQQLEGYCEQMDSDELLPFDDRDLSAEMAKKAERYYAIPDMVIELLEKDGRYNSTTKGLKAAPRRDGYARYIYIEDFAVAITYNRDFWKSSNSIETPFWLSVRTKDWKETVDILDVLKTIDEHKKENSWATFIALEPPINATMQEVAEGIKNQIMYYLDKFMKKDL